LFTARGWRPGHILNSYLTADRTVTLEQWHQKSIPISIGESTAIHYLYRLPCAAMLGISMPTPSQTELFPEFGPVNPCPPGGRANMDSPRPRRWTYRSASRISVADS